MSTAMPFLLFGFTILVLMAGYPVALSLSGSALIFAFFGYLTGTFDPSFLGAIPERLFGIMRNETLIAVPLFIFMGVVLQKGQISERLLVTMGRLFGRRRGGLAISVCLVGAILGASTGIVGATVVTMGLISLPVMMRYKYSTPLACGVITASGTLGQIIPPSIVLVILGDVISNANQKAQLAMGNFSPDAVSVGDLFFGALFPGLVLVSFYMAYIIVTSLVSPESAPSVMEEGEEPPTLDEILRVLLPPIALIVCVLGSILAGYATPTEASAVGALGALALTMLNGQLTMARLREAMENSIRINCMVFVILIGASIFSLVFRGFEGDEIVTEFILAMPGGEIAALIMVMLLIFLLGFFLDFIEIIFVVVPIVAPILLQLGYDPIWLGVMFAVNLQTSFLTPPFGFALFYLKGVAPEGVTTGHIYRGVAPFIVLQLFGLVFLWFFPDLATWLPKQIYG